MKIIYHFLFWAVYLLLESYLTYAMGEWGLRNLVHSLVYHGSLLIPRMILAYLFIYAIIPYLHRCSWNVVVKLISYLLFFSVSLFVYRAFLNLVSWPLIMNHHPDFDVFDLRLSAYSFLKLVTPMFLLLGILSVNREYSIRIINQQLEKEKYKSELQLLKAQIHPHFLFNTLNNLYVLALEKSDKTAGAIAKLSSLFRYVLEHSTQEWVTIKQEMNLIQDYLDLERLRYNADFKLKLHTDISDEKLLMPPLLLLPFIENAFKHGASESSGSFINIEIWQDSKSLNFKCENSFDHDNRDETIRIGKGIENVISRITLLYPNRFTYRKQLDKHIYKVFLSIPLQEADAG